MAYTKELVAEKLITDNNWLFKGILAIYARQTASEQSYGETVEDNGVGFNSADANILSSFATQISEWNSTPVARRRFATPLSVKQVEIARKKMKKYAGQLAAIANANTGQTPEPRQRRTRQVNPPVVANHTPTQNFQDSDYDR